MQPSTLAIQRTPPTHFQTGSWFRPVGTHDNRCAHSKTMSGCDRCGRALDVRDMRAKRLCSPALLWALFGGWVITSNSAAPGLDFAGARQLMVAEQLAGRDITNRNVLRVMSAVPRHELVSVQLRASAYGDHPLPIGHDQTISQPYIVAFMTQALDPRTNDVVLEVGTGSGYQAAVLAGLVK